MKMSGRIIKTRMTGSGISVQSMTVTISAYSKTVEAFPYHFAAIELRQLFSRASPMRASVTSLTT